MPKKLLTVDQVAERMGVSAQTVRNRIMDKTVRPVPGYPALMTIVEAEKIIAQRGGRPSKKGKK